MESVLATPFRILPVTDSAYANSLKIKDTDFHILREALTDQGPFPHELVANPPDFVVYRLKSPGPIFDKLYHNWNQGTAQLYRGISGAHFSWDGVRRGEFKSEGDTDMPTFTMGNAQPTRWLPTDAEDGPPCLIAVGGLDNWTRQILEKHDVPCGAVLSIPVGRRIDLPICYLNEGEIAVRGPLTEPQFEVHKVTYVGPRGYTFADWPAGCGAADLMPTRPYDPKQHQIDEWWKLCEAWMRRMVLYGTKITATAVPGSLRHSV